MRGRGERGCDPELIFEFVDRGLEPKHRQEVRTHLDECPECRELYRRELDLNASLRSCGFSGPEAPSVSRGVAMALPTRPIRARFLWSLLAAALLVSALFALELSVADPVALAMGAPGVIWSFASGFADVIHTFFAVAGSTLVTALVVGALLDLLLVVALLSASRLARRA